MGKKNKIKDIIAISQPTSATVRADKKEIKILGLVSPELDDYASVLKLNPYVALKYFDSEWQCFSEWEKQELKEFSNFLNNFKRNTWEQVYKTGSTVPKHGLAYTKYKLKDVKSPAIKSKLQNVANLISPEIDFFRITS